MNRRGVLVGLMVLTAVTGLALAGQVAVAGGVAGLALLAGFLFTVRHTRNRIARDPLEGLSLDSQARMRPFLKVREEIRMIVDRNPGHPALTVVGLEAVSEADELVSGLLTQLRMRSEAARWVARPAARESLAAFDAQVKEAQAALEAIRDDLSRVLAEGLAHDDSLRTRLGQIQSLRTSLAESQEVLGQKP